MLDEKNKIFDNLECFETRFEGIYYFNPEKNGRIYSGSGIIFEDKIHYNVNFFRKRIASSTYSHTLTEFSGELHCENKTYKLVNVIMDIDEDEFLFTFAHKDETIQLDCKKVDFKFQCDYLSK